MSTELTEEIWVREPSPARPTPTFRRVRFTDDLTVTLTHSELTGLLRLAGYRKAVDATATYELEES